MSNFNKYLSSRRVDVDVDRIARLMVQKNVDPNWYIRRYLEAMESDDGLILEGWLGSFFKRIGNAWSGFWKDPNPQDSPSTRLEAAKKALQDLVQMVQQNQGAESNVLGVVLRGLEQSLGIIDKIEPPLKTAEPRIKQFQAAQAGGQAGTVMFQGDPNNRLPDDLHQKFEDIMHRRNMLIQQPDSEAKATNLVKNDDELLQFRQQLEDQYQQMAPKTPQDQQNKERIKTFLTRIDTDATFREIESLLDFARKRTQGNNLMVSRPQGYEQAVLAFRNIAATTTDPKQQKDQLLHWYQSLPANNPVKQFVMNDVREHPELGNELELFWKYSQEWINKLPHFLASR